MLPFFYGLPLLSLFMITMVTKALSSDNGHKALSSDNMIEQLESILQIQVEDHLTQF